MLRYQPEIGADLDSPLVRYLTLPVVPVQLGFDPRLQLLHADDATGALEAAVRRPGPRAGQRRARRRDLAQPHPAPAAATGAAASRTPLFGPAIEQVKRRLGAGGLLGDGVRLLRYGRGVDNTRLREEVGYEPRYDAVGRGSRLRRQDRRPAARAADSTAGALAGRLTGIGS